MKSIRTCLGAFPVNLTIYLKVAATRALLVHFVGLAHSSEHAPRNFRLVEGSFSPFLWETAFAASAYADESGSPQVRAFPLATSPLGESSVVQSDSGAQSSTTSVQGMAPKSASIMISNRPRARESPELVVLADASAANSVSSFEPLLMPRDVHARGIAMENWPRSISPLKRPPGLGISEFKVTKSKGEPPTLEALESVGRQATEQQAIDTSRVNLIGIFGTNEKRKALVRFKNGSIRNVKVNSKLLGGRVISIDSSEVTLVRGGRTYRLKLEN